MSRERAFALLGDKSAWTLPAIVRRQAQRYGERPFLSFASGAALSFAGFDRECDTLARALAATGLARGDRVLAMLRNRAELLLLAIACGRIGAIFVPVNTEMKGYSLQHQLHNCAPALVFVEADLTGAFAAVAAPAKLPTAVVVVDAAPAEEIAAFAGVRHWRYGEFAALQGGQALADPSPQEIACIMYTSGTTGPAKGVLMPHAHLALFAVPSAGLELGEDDVYYVAMPLFHANALFIQVFGSLLCGARVHCVERFSPNRWLAEVRACGATVTNLLGAMSEMVFKTPELPDDKDNPLRAILAVPVADWVGRFCERFGVHVCQGFGMTECNMIAYATKDDPCLPGCAGTVRGDLFDVAIVDPETDEPVAEGEVGEIVVRPKIANAFMHGYFGMPEKTVEAWRNLWFHTGDAGRREGSLLYFVDRIKDRIRRRGENVSAFEVEQAINALAGVGESAVIGVRVGDAAAEQEVMACVVRADGAALTERQVLDHCLARVPRFAVPRFIQFVAELPKTVSGKVQKQALRERGAAAAWDRESGATK